jgi:hypothetical protein
MEVRPTTDAEKDWMRACVTGQFTGTFGEWMKLPMDERERLSALRGKSPEALTNERKSTHGDWVEQSATANALKGNMRGCPGWTALTASQKEALDMIATKMSRILTGNPNEPDHWDDIAGYAFLGKGGHARG